MTKRFIIVLCLLFQVIGLLSQETVLDYGIRRFGLTVEEPFHSAYKIHQDSLGRLVAYTSYNSNNEKLIYDGSKFLIENQPDTRFKNLLEEKDGKWIVEDAFFLKFKGEELNLTFDVRKYQDRNISSLKKVDNFYYIITNDGFIKFKRAIDSLEIISHQKYDIERIKKTHISGDSIFFLTSKNLCYILQSNPDEYHKYFIPDLKNNDLFLLPDGRLRIESKNGFEFHNKSSPYYEFLLKQKRGISSKLIDSKSRLWVNVRNNNYNGTYLLTPENPNPKEVTLGIEKNTYRNFYEDNLGDMWIGTSGQGLIHLYDQSISVLNKKTGLSSDNIYGITHSEKTNKVYISTSCAGVDVMKNGTVVDHLFGTNCQGFIFIDSKDNIWIPSAGLHVFRDGKEIRVYDKSDGLHSRTIHCMLEDKNGDIWASTRQVLHKVDGKIMIKYQISGLDVYDRIISMVELNNGSLLLAVDNGTYFSFHENTFTRIQQDTIIPRTLFKDQEGSIWLATAERGLLLFDGTSFNPIAANKSVPQSITFLQDSDNGLLFGLCSDNTIFYAQKEDLKSVDSEIPIQILSKDDGLPLIDSNSKIQPVTALLDDGSIVFPNIYGAIKIDPNKLLSKKQQFKIFVTHADTFVNNNIILPDRINHLDLEVLNIYLNPQSSIESQYILDGELWKTVPKTNNINLTGLASGNHNLQIRSKHVNQDNWENSSNIQIFVPTPIFLRWWFILTCSILFACMMYLYTYWRTINVKNQNTLLEAKVTEQTNALNEEKTQLSESLGKQKELTRQLNISQATKNRMYAQISHEFKSPLQAIKSYLSKGESIILQEDKNRIKGNIDNLLNISNEIMELSKAESGNLKIKKNWYNINGIIADQIEINTPLANAKNITIVHPSSHDKQYLEIDLSLIQKVINNLLSNAIKYSKKESVIQIESYIRNHLHYIKVIDNGPGIPEDEIDNLTIAYYQASNSTERGTGIGLSLVQEILKLHDSKLQIDSKLGYGSSFGFAIKRSNIPQEEILKLHVESSSINNQLKHLINPNKPKILIIDDSPDVLFFLHQALEPKYQVISAENGEQALKYLDQIDPTVIISDYNMPIMNGIELLKKVRSMPQHQALPFLFLTGSSSEETVLISLKEGADMILQKPIEEEKLMSHVAQLLDRQMMISASIKSSFAHDLLPKNIHNDDLELMLKLEKIFLENIDNGKIKSNEIASIIGVGEKTLRNRVKKINGKTIKEYFRNFRLEKAKLLLEQGYGTMGEVAIATGFSSLSYFSKSYKAYFSKSSEQSS